MKKMMIAFALLVSPLFAHALSLEEIRSYAVTELLIKDSQLKEKPFFQLKTWDIQHDGESDLVAVKIQHAAVGEIRLMMKGPKNFWMSKETLKVLLIASGFHTGQDSVKLMGDTHGAVLVGYEYPYNANDFQRKPATLPDFFRKTPAQIAATMMFLAQQPWVDRYEMGAMGISLGGLFMPTAVHMAQSMGVPFYKTALGFTGAHLPAVLDQAFAPYMDAQVREALVHSINNLTSIYDPKLHLPFLKGRFLMLQASHDEVFPKQSTQILADIMPEPKKIVTIEGPHINEGQKEMIAQLQRELLKWF